MAAPIRQGFSIRIKNPPWRDLVIWDLKLAGPNGAPQISVSCSSGDGQARFPEMVFAVERVGVEMKMAPLSLRREESSLVEHCALELCGKWMTLKGIEQAHLYFAEVWDRQLLDRGYWEAFVRERKENWVKSLG